ncbi:MAG: polyprenyl synthetase family protein [Bacteroidales bacterium]|nr:polyprenyl synthetase family protein [Bacteroidales bacterium]
MLSLEDAGILIEKKILNLQFPDNPRELYDPVRYILKIGGKRIRPSLVLLGANMFNDNVEEALDPAIAIEIFHNFTLLHDDLMDNSRIRRGQETVHIRWNPNIAILSGDTMSILANRYVTRVRPEILPQVLETFNQTAVEVCEGQMMDMNFENRGDVSVDEYIRMIELKTSVLIAASLKIGGMVGGASEKQAHEIYEFGRHLGIAFQLQDDLLDTYGETRTFGKKIGNDILTNKKTFLMISALENADSLNLEKLNEWLKREKFDPEEKVKDIKTIYDACGVKKLTLEKINEYFEASMHELEKISVPDDRKIVLKTFSENLMKREV